MAEITTKDLKDEIARLKADPSVERVDLSGRDFSGLTLEGIDLSGSNLSGCDFAGARLRGCDFSDSNLAGASLRDVVATGERFLRAEMGGADLEGANLEGADFSGANLSGADLRKTNLTDAKLEGAILGGADLILATMPDGSLYRPDKHDGAVVERSAGGRRLKILLTMPTWTEDLGGFSRIGKARNPQVPLGLLYLATLAEDQGHEVAFIDCDVESVTINELVRRTVEGGYDLVGLTATSPIFHKAVVAAEAIKKAMPQVKTIIGGDHFSIFGAEVFYPCFDFGCVGEAEETWPEFLDYLVRGETDFGDVNGLVWRKDGQTMINMPRRLFPNLDKLPLPAVHLTQMDMYRMTFALRKNRKIGKYVSIMMTRGCPFKCSYCSESSDVKYGGDVVKMRFRSAKNIVDEIEFHYRTHGVRHFFFMDSNITLKKKHTVELCNEIIERKLPITFEGWTRANLLTEELMALLVKAGLVRMSCGVESGDPEILKIIKKDVPQEAVRNLFRWCTKYGVEAMCSAMLGNPGETKASVQKTIRFLDSIPDLLYTNFSIANPYPGTEMLMWAREGKYGLRLRYDELSKYTRYDDSPIEVNDLKAEDLVRYQALGLIKIHLKPRRFIAAIRMLGVASILPVFIRMMRKVLSKGSEALSVFFPRQQRDGQVPQ